MRISPLALVMLIAFGGCGPQLDIDGVAPRNTQVKISPTTLGLVAGQTYTLEATVTDDTTGVLSGVTWSSSLPGVATISNAGSVTALAPGSTTIIATSRFNASRAAATQVTVQVVPTTLELFIVPSTATIAPNGTIQFVFGSQGSGVTWSSSAPAVAVIDSRGSARGVSAGTTVITATYKVDPTVTATAVLTVTGFQ